MIKLFIFDMGGVLARNVHILPEAAEILGLSHEEALDCAREDMMPLMEGTLGAAEFWRRFGRRGGVTVDREFWGELFKPSLDDSTLELIGRLKENCRVVCGTNTLKEHYDIHRERGDYGVFDTVYASHLMGVAKPKAEFYQWILQREGVSPEEVVFTDDYPENIETAESLGIHSFLFREADLLIKELREAELGGLTV